MAKKRGRKHESRMLPVQRDKSETIGEATDYTDFTDCVSSVVNLGAMKRYFTMAIAIAFAMPAYRAPDAATLSRAGLPTEQMAKEVLSAALKDRHPQWSDIPVGSAKIPSFIVFPERTDHAPVLVITAQNQGMTDWLRAVADDAAQQGFIAIVPDLLKGTGQDAVLHYAINMPASNGNGASVNFN